MNWTVFIIEAVVLCAVFHLIIYRMVMNAQAHPDMVANGYHPAIVQRMIDLGKAEVRDVPSRWERIKKKWPAAIVIGILLGLVVYFLNGCRTFLSGFLVSYALWLIVDWYDALVIDILWFCHSKSCILPGTEDMTDVYHDYGYHIRSSAVGMLIGLPVCLVIGLTVQVLAML